MAENAIHEKNIENLVNEIKEAEKKINKETKRTRLNKKFSSMRFTMPKIELTSINIKTIQYILSNKTRNENMLIVLNALLSNMKFISVVKDLEDKEKLIYSLSNYLKLEKRQKGSILFRFGNKGSKFYVVLGGEISVLIPKEIMVELTFLNYIKYLLYLKVIKEDELAKKIININQNPYFKITDRHLDKYYEDILSFINKYYKITSLNNEKSLTSMKKKIKDDSRFNRLEQEINKITFDKEIETIKKNKLLFNKKQINKEDIQPKTENPQEIENDFLSSNIEESKGKKEIKKSKENVKGNSSIIKFNATSKVPNYFELDIETFGPHDISNLVNYVMKKIEFFSRKENHIYSPEEYIKMCFIDDELKISDKNLKKEKVSIFQYFEITKKVEGDIFGELALQHDDNKRTATMITTKNSVFGILSKNDYIYCLKGIGMKKRKIDINFIMSFSIFDEHNWLTFEKQYFNYFKKEILKSGQVIIHQNEPFENLYFIKEGQFEISTNLSYKDINIILKEKSKRIKEKKYDKNDYSDEEDKFNDNENNKIFEDNKDIKENNINENIDTNNNDEKTDKSKKKESKKYMLLSSQINKQMNEMKYYRLCVIDNKDMVGLNDICWDNKKSFITATCISSEAVAFSIKINILDLLMKKNRKLEKNVQEITKKREIIMMERLKIATKKVLLKTNQNNKINLINHQKDEKLNLKKEKRIRSALKTHFSLKMTQQYKNNVNNNEKNRQNIIKRNFENNEILTLSKLNEKNYQNNFNNLKQNNNNSKEKVSINTSLKKQKPKTGFQKFMESVTERVNQINHHSNFTKFSILFCPVNNKKISLNSDKKEDKKVFFGVKPKNIKTIPNLINNMKQKNNLINDNDGSMNEENITKMKIEYSSLGINEENNLDSTIKSNGRQVLSNQYLNSLITNRNIIKNNALHKFQTKTYSPEITNYQNETLDLNKEYIKKILGVRYKDYEGIDGNKTLSKLLLPEIENTFKLRYIKNNKYNFKTRNIMKPKFVSINPKKVDLLIYDHILKKNNNNYINRKNNIAFHHIKKRNFTKEY